MGPRLDSRGRSGPAHEVAMPAGLQWGRGWTAAEGGRPSVLGLV